MKLLVQTTGDFMFMEPYTGQEISAYRPTVVERSYFTQSRVAAGQIEVISTVSDEATDEEFKQYWDASAQKDGNVNKQHDLAVDSFNSKFEKKASKKDLEAQPDVALDQVNAPVKGKRAPASTATTGKPANEPDEIN